MTNLQLEFYSFEFCLNVWILTGFYSIEMLFELAKSHMIGIYINPTQKFKMR